LWAASALHLARWELSNMLPTQPSKLKEWISWAKTFRTLSFCYWCVCNLGIDNWYWPSFSWSSVILNIRFHIIEREIILVSNYPIPGLEI
jgi:hypothetical protein